MTKTELISEITKMDFVDSIESQPVVTKEDGVIKSYRVIVREISADGKCLNLQAIPFYVIDEGKTTEAAYYRNRVPESMLITKTEAEIKE